MLKILRYPVYFGFLAGVGIIFGCFIHGLRTNQPTIMSGVAFVRELPYGERTVGVIETTVFSWQEWLHLRRYKTDNPVIKIDPRVKADQDKLFQ